MFDDSICEPIQSSYFGGTKSAVGFPELSYVWQYGNVDHVNYPWKEPYLVLEYSSGALDSKVV